MNDLLSIANNPLEVVSTTVIILAGAFIAFSQRVIFKVNVQTALILYVWHTVFSFAYLHFTTHNIADSIMYYHRSLLPIEKLELGTGAVIGITRVLTAGLSLSYGGAFMVYNILGFLGMIAFASALQEVTVGSRAYAWYVALGVLFLPGLSFWSGFIGKDALTLLGSGLLCWAALNLSRRYLVILAALLLFLVARPHIAGILAVSLSVTSILFMRMGLLARVVALAVLAPACVVLVIFGLEFAGVTDPTSLAAVSDRIELQAGRNMEGGSSVSISEMSLPVRAFSYLFRPMIVDADGLLGLVVSLENLVLLTIVLAAVLSLGRNRSSLSKWQIAFYLTFSAASLLLLSNTTANLGIAVRQKWMFLPMILTLAISIVGRPKLSAGAASELELKRPSNVSRATASAAESLKMRAGHG